MSRERAVERPPGVLVLDGSLIPRSWTAAARGWIDALPAARLNAAWGILPTVIYPTATLARSGAGTDRAHALLRGVDGQWVMIEAARLEGDRDGEIAVTLRAPTPVEIFRLLSRIYALTARERELVRLLLAGLDTRAVGDRLHISAHTVQDHLKSIFGKTGMHSRRALLATLGASETDGGSRIRTGGGFFDPLLVRREPIPLPGECERVTHSQQRARGAATRWFAQCSVLPIA